MPGLQLVGDYHYSGATIGGRKFSIVRNGSELQRVREVFDTREGILVWDQSMPMTLEVLGVLKHERRL